MLVVFITNIGGVGGEAIIKAVAMAFFKLNFKKYCCALESELKYCKFN